MRNWSVLILVAAVAFVGCSPDGDGQGQSNNGANNGSSDAGSNGGDDTGSSDEVTYYQHVKPMLESNCVNCHTEGGIAPFTLDSYEAAKGYGALMVQQVTSGAMPPWPPQEGCGEFQHTRDITSEEIETLTAWQSNGMPEGDPASAVDGELDDSGDLGDPDFVADPGFDYTPDPPEGGIDDYHCFVIDPELEEDEFLHAFDSVPGNNSIVHHVLLYSATADQADVIQQREDEDPSTQGYTCFGGPRVNEPTLLGGWVPGTVPLDFGEDKGIRIEAGSKLIMQVHYNTLNDKEGSDRTKINLHYTDGEPDVELAMLPLAQPDLDIPAGDSDVTETASVNLPLNIDLYGVVPHMHQLGQSIDVKYTDSSGEETCLVNIPEWDFDWQGFYLYKEPLTIPARSTVTLTCTYDNSPENQPEGRTPRDVTWGEGTFDEMCLNYVIIRRPPGL
jgi:mono/diheme cytochrome c family protein